MRPLRVFLLTCAIVALTTASAGAKRFIADVPVSKAPADVWAVGDADLTPGGRSVSALVSHDTAIDRLLYLGDVYTSGTAAQFATRYTPLYGALRPITAPVPGNHEWPNRFTGYYPYWTAARGSKPPLYYRFAINGWQILSLNTEINRSASSPQRRWLKRALKRSKRFGNCRIVLTHRPRYSVSTHGDDTASGPLWQTVRGHARLWLSGHEHNMQEFAPSGGITQIVAGSGGRALYKTIGKSAGTLRWSDTNHYGALRLSISGNRARWSFTGAGGATLRSGVTHCSHATN